VNEGLGITLEKLNISNPSSKTERTLKKLSKKLASRLKVEVKRQAQAKQEKRNKSNAKEMKSAQHPKA